MKKFNVCLNFALSLMLLANSGVAVLSQEVTSDDKAQMKADEQSGKLTDLNKTKKKSRRVLALSETPIDNATAKVYDCVTFRVVEPVVVDNQVVIDCGSKLVGKVIHVKQPKRFPMQDGIILVQFEKLQLASGECYDIMPYLIRGKIVNQKVKGTAEQIIERAPIAGIAQAITIPLRTGTEISGGVVYAISLAGTMVAGAIYGFVDPDIGQGRGESAFKRSIAISPLGTLYGIGAMGKPADIAVCDPLVISLDQKTIQKISSQRSASIK